MIDISWLVEQGPCKRFAAGERIPCPGGSNSSDRAMYILLTGRVDVFKVSAAGGTQTAGSLLPGDVFGGREFFTDADDSTYLAGLDSVTYVITKNSYDDLSWSRPDILFEVFKAAYVPLRKMTASEKTAMVAAASESVAKQKNETKPKTPLLPEEDVASYTLLWRGKPSDDEGVFPKGHKSFPGVFKPEYSRLVFKKDYDCPCCKRPFQDYKIFRSKLFEAAPTRYDLRRFYTDFQIEWYDVITCRSCFFSTFQNYFTEPKPIQKVKFEKELSEVRASIHLDFDTERDIDYVFTSHYIALLCSEGYLSLGKHIRAKLWGNLSWLYEDVSDEVMAMFCAGKAAEVYESIYADTYLTPVQEQIICLSTAGMQYRAGENKNLKKFLFIAKTIKMGDRTYAKLAEDFMYEIHTEDDDEN